MDNKKPQPEKLYPFRTITYNRKTNKITIEQVEISEEDRNKLLHLAENYDLGE